MGGDKTGDKNQEQGWTEFSEFRFGYGPTKFVSKPRVLSLKIF